MTISGISQKLINVVIIDRLEFEGVHMAFGLQMAQSASIAPAFA